MHLSKEKYASKGVSSFNVKLDNHQKDFKKLDNLLARKNFQEKNQ